MTQLSQWFNAKTTAPLALAALLLFLLFTALVLPRQAAQAEQVTGQAGSPDTSLYYGASDLYGWAQSYGEEGRRAYIRARLTFDVVWPLVYTLFLVTALSWLTPRAFPRSKLWSLANLVPILGMIFDFLENASAALVMARYPQPTPLIAALAGPFTTLKWLFVYAAFALLLITLLTAARRRTQQSDG